MANLSIVSNPDVYATPGFNDLVWYVNCSSSPNNGSINYCIAADVNIISGPGATAWQTVVSKNYRVPDTNGNVTFEVSRIVQSFLTNNYFMGLSGATGNPNSVALIELVLYETYDPSGGGTAGVSSVYDQTTSACLTWNAALSYDDFANFNHAAFVGGTSGAMQLLTKQPSTISIGPGDEATLSFLQNSLVGVTATSVDFSFQTTGATVADVTWTGPWSSTLLENAMLTIGVGPGNLAISGNPVYQNVTGYTVSVGVTGGGTIYSQSYNINRNFYPTPPTVLTWLNELGGWDTYSFPLINNESTNISRTEYDKLLSRYPKYKQGDRGRTLTSISSVVTRVATTDYVDQATADWLYDSLYDSIEVYEVHTNFPSTYTSTKAGPGEVFAMGGTMSGTNYNPGDVVMIYQNVRFAGLLPFGYGTVVTNTGTTAANMSIHFCNSIVPDTVNDFMFDPLQGPIAIGATSGVIFYSTSMSQTSANLRIQVPDVARFAVGNTVRIDPDIPSQNPYQGNATIEAISGDWITLSIYSQEFEPVERGYIWLTGSNAHRTPVIIKDSNVKKFNKNSQLRKFAVTYEVVNKNRQRQ